MKSKIKGVILIISCHKHLFSRLQEFGPKNKEYDGWIVHKIIGNPHLSENFVIDQKTGIITIKCEDSYIHVMKKVVLAIELMLNMYDIQEGILRCGDDLVFNDDILDKFIRLQNKNDYIGLKNKLYPQNETNFKRLDSFMVDYYNKNQQDFNNHLHGISTKRDLIFQCNSVPTGYYAGGVVVYLSRKSCDILVKHMQEINYDVFTNYEKYGYPYIIEDIGVGFVMNLNKIELTPMLLYSDQPCDYVIGYHTNKYK